MKVHKNAEDAPQIIEEQEDAWDAYEPPHLEGIGEARMHQDDFDQASDHQVGDPADDIDFNMLVDKLRNYSESGFSIFDRRCQSILDTLRAYNVIE